MKNSNSILISILVLILQIFPNLTKAQDEITFGDQTWTLRNLNVEKFRNGDNIQEVKSKEDWVRLYDSKQPAWCYYEFDKSNEAKYGKLYNWYAIKDDRGFVSFPKLRK